MNDRLICGKCKKRCDEVAYVISNGNEICLCEDCFIDMETNLTAKAMRLMNKSEEPGSREKKPCEK